MLAKVFSHSPHVLCGNVHLRAGGAIGGVSQKSETQDAGFAMFRAAS